MTKTKTRPRSNPGTITNNKGEICAPAPKGPNPELLPSVTVELTADERKVIVRLVERIPIGARTVLERGLLEKANSRKKETELNGAERFAIRHYIEKTPLKQRTDVEKSLRDKVAHYG